MKRIALFILLASFALTLKAQNEDSAWFYRNIEKKVMMIPMRDGKKLYTVAYVFKDGSKGHPVLLTRTPYSSGPYDEKLPALYKDKYRFNYIKNGYILVSQDVRGRFMSEGEFEDVRPINKNKKGKETDEASDSYDAIEYLVKNLPGNNGRVGVMGISYPGFYSTMAAASGHPALKAVSPQAPVTDWFIGDDFHHNGVFFAMDGFGFYSSFGKPRPVPTTKWTSGFEFPIKDKYSFFLEQGWPKNLSRLIGDSIKFWHEMAKHPNYDEFWQARNARNSLYKIKPAMLWVGGLFDAEDLFGAWASYKAAEKQSPQTNNKIVMGPWSHGQWSRSNSSFLGNIWFEGDQAGWYQKNIEFPFFEKYLKEKELPELPEASIFFTGENKWRSLDTWPPANGVEQAWYLNSSGKLNHTTDADGYKDYISDPAKPVPYNEGVHASRTREYMTDDQRFAAQRPDVLVYQTDILTEDITLAGPLTASLDIATVATDVDLVVKLIDVFPNDFQYPDSIAAQNNKYMMEGYQMPVRFDIMRAKYRNSFENPEPLVPGKKTNIKFVLPDLAHTFKKGHRIMVQVQSTWFPLADRNPQQFMNIYEAEPSDYKKAAIHVYGSSSITVNVLKN